MILTNQQKQDDIKFLKLAINLATRNLHYTGKNPRVGCVIVKDQVILSTATTGHQGKAHAEAIAIEKIGDKNILKDSTIYITLEPCCDFKEKESLACVDKIIKYKFKRVVIAKLDLNPNINGKSIEKLKQAKIETEIIDIKNNDLHQDFFCTIVNKIPLISIKIASSLDSKIACYSHQSKWITSERSRHYGHFLRAKHDAILIGANTLRIDNPKLDCRINGLENFSPKKIIISNKLDFLNNYHQFLVFDQLQNVLIITGESQLLNLNNNIKKVFANNLIFAKEKIVNQNKQIDLKNALELLVKHDIKSVLVEGGKTVITNLLKENLINKIYWIRSNKILGNDAISAIDNLNIVDIVDCFNQFNYRKIIESDTDIIEVLSK